MIPTIQLTTNAAAYDRKYGQGLKAAQTIMGVIRGMVDRRELPEGTFLPSQFMLQLTGKEETGLDLIQSFLEKQLPYGASSNIGVNADCWEVNRDVMRIFMGVDFDTADPAWTEGAYGWGRKHPDRVVKIENAQEGDIILYNFKKGRHASHAAYVLDPAKYILHTRSKSKPFMLDSIGYAKNDIVMVIRPYTTEQYESLHVKHDAPAKTDLIYVVRRGDTLRGIATKHRRLGYKVTWQSIARLNKIKSPNIIRPGQNLKIV